MITYECDGVKMPKIRKRDTSSWIRHVAAYYGKRVGEIGYTGSEPPVSTT